MKLTEKAAYLKGLMDGMNFDKNTNEGKLIAGIIDMMDDLALSVSDLEDETATLSEYVEELDEDLGSVEEDLYGEEDDEEDDDDDFVEIECPHCGEEVYFDESIDPEHIICPACGQEFSCVCDCGCEDDDDDEDGCGCEHCK